MDFIMFLSMSLSRPEKGLNRLIWTAEPYSSTIKKGEILLGLFIIVVFVIWYGLFRFFFSVKSNTSCVWYKYARVHQLMCSQVTAYKNIRIIPLQYNSLRIGYGSRYKETLRLLSAIITMGSDGLFFLFTPCGCYKRDLFDSRAWDGYYLLDLMGTFHAKLSMALG